MLVPKCRIIKRAVCSTEWGLNVIRDFSQAMDSGAIGNV